MRQRLAAAAAGRDCHLGVSALGQNATMKPFTPWILFAAGMLANLSAIAQPMPPTFPDAPPPPAPSLRVATFNTSLYEETAGGLIARLQAGDADARKIAAIIQRQRPDVLLLNEFDFDAAQQAAELFQRNYLEVSQFGETPIRYDYRYLAPVNTGTPSGLDLNRDGQVGGEGRTRGDDAWGYGLHPGQYGMLLLSRYPIDAAAARSFQTLRWASLPGANPPKDPTTGGPWLPPEIWSQLRLSSKSHWDVPVDTPLGRIHMLAAHPTPPAFDGPEQRNSHRNFDEIKLWVEYLTPGDKPWLCDDQGRCGPLAADARFVILGDHNADPVDGGGLPGAIAQLLAHPRLLSVPTPRSNGAAQAPQIGVNRSQHASPDTDTGQFGPRTGNLRVDYVLPSRDFRYLDSGVFWPATGEPGVEWIDASDHHLVWVDLTSERPLP